MTLLYSKILTNNMNKKINFLSNFVRNGEKAFFVSYIGVEIKYRGERIIDSLVKS